MKKNISRKLKRRLILSLAKRLPPCKVLLPLVSDERERPLTVREKVTVKLHLFTCAACRRYVWQIELMSEILNSQTKAEISAEPTAKLSAESRKRIKDALEAAVHHKN